MIVWINGSFGVGKTAVSLKIREKYMDDKIELLESDVYAEEVLKEIVKEAKMNNYFPNLGGTLPQNNIRFLDKFKKLIEEKSEDANKVLLVDMALTMRVCKERLFDSLVADGKRIIHIILTADKETMEFRIRNDHNRDKQLALDELESDFLEKNFEEAIRIKTDNRSTDDIANEIIRLIESLGMKSIKESENAISMTKLFDLNYGAYLPAFAIITVNASINFQDFESNDDETKGTFIHEYCHYLQDVSTTYGYINFIYSLQELLIKLGMSEASIQEKMYNRDFYGLYYGDTNIEDETFLINNIEIKENELLIDEYPDESVECVMITYNGKKSFCFGNCCVAESMAYLVEKRLYNVKERFEEFPYNICEMICKKEYPEFAQNEIFIMALCELSLLELSSGVFFIKALRLMKEKNFIPQNVVKMEKFLDSHFKLGFRGNRNNLQEILSVLYPGKDEEFSKVKKWILSRYELGCKYREKHSKMFISLILSIADRQDRYEMWNTIMKAFGAPNILDNRGYVFDGGSLNGESIDLTYMLGPWAIESILGPDGKYNDKPCPLREVCKFTEEYYCSFCEEKLIEKLKEDGDCFLGIFWRLYNMESLSI